MDDMEPAAATNSAVFGKNKFGTCCEENILAFEAFEAQAMSQEGMSESMRVAVASEQQQGRVHRASLRRLTNIAWLLLPIPRPTIHLQKMMRPLRPQKTTPKFPRVRSM